MLLSFTKQELNFSFRNPVWDTYDNRLRMEFKIEGIRENAENEGFFYNAEYSPQDETMRMNYQVGEQRCKGVKPSEEILSQIKAIYEELKEKDLHQKLYGAIRFNVNDTTDYGIHNGISPFSVKEIIKDICKKYEGDWLFYWKDIARELSHQKDLEDLAMETYQAFPEGKWKPEYLAYYRAAAKEKRAHGFGIIPNKIIREKIEAIVSKRVAKEKQLEKDWEERVQNSLKTAQNSGQKQLLEHWLEDCNVPEEECSLDVCYKWINPNGEITITRQHTW